MLFPKRQDYTPTQTWVLGQTVTFELTREFHIESIYLEVDMVDNVAAQTAQADGLTGIVQRVQVGVSDGAQNRNVVDITGAGLLELELNTVGTLDAATTTLFRANTATGGTITYPIRFVHPQLTDPVGSVLLLPAPRFNSNPVVTVRFATQAQMDSGATPAFAVTTGTVRLIIVRRQVTRSNFPTFNTELSELSTAYPTTGNAQLQELQIPGSYTGILIRDYASLTSRAFIETAGGENKLQLLGTVLRRFRCQDILRENQRSMVNLIGTGVPTILSGAAYLDFLSDKLGQGAGDLGSVLDANILQASGARVQLLQDITGRSNIKRNLVTHRIYGNLKALKF